MIESSTHNTKLQPQSRMSGCYALFFMGIHKCISILVPKKRGIGYLKSPFGGHHCNKHYFEFTSLNLTYVGDCCDIDGYLSIDFRLNQWDEEYQFAINEIMTGIVTVFKQCEGYKEIDAETFYRLIK